MLAVNALVTRISLFQASPVWFTALTRIGFMTPLNRLPILQEMTQMIKVCTRQAMKNPRSLAWALFLLPMLAAALLTVASNSHADKKTLAPSVEYLPEQVVKIVVDALQSNSVEDNNSGIATVYRFASPGNRANTGPLSRFTNMILRGFPDMLNHEGARYDPMKITGDSAVQAVWLFTDSGAEVGYAFQLGRQPSGEFEGMWMTDAVVPLGRGPGSGTKI